MKKTIQMVMNDNHEYIQITSNLTNSIDNNDQITLINGDETVQDSNIITDTNKSFLRFVVISDTHQLHDLLPNPLPQGDVLIHCGDFTNVGMPKEIESFMEYLFTNCDHLYKYIILIPGNHEWSSDIIVKYKINSMIKNYKKEKKLNATYYYLLNELITIENKINIYGKRFKNSAMSSLIPLMRDSLQQKEYDNIIPKNVNILLTHIPSKKGNLDIVHSGKSRGNSELTKVIDDPNYFTNLKFHIFGHCHNGRGVHYDDNRDIVFINGENLLYLIIY
ncbi:hypothetical protein ABK040_006755 [Willaertia magna]